MQASNDVNAKVNSAQISTLKNYASGKMEDIEKAVANGYNRRFIASAEKFCV